MGAESRVVAAGSVLVKRDVRPDIQGLRMIAVVAVILDHLVGWPLGGFAGVDIFFVISGFLITGLLIREHERTNRISFTGFYRRRLKRIVPAATATLVLTIIAAFVLFNTSRFAQTAWDAAYAFLFSANWHFAAAGTNYFSAAEPPSPLQHFWSLSVEEQFYFVWPWLMVGVLTLVGLWTRAGMRRMVLGIVMLLIVAGSFGWALLDTVGNPTVAYFSTFTRTWELGFGALLAIAAPWWAKLPTVIRPVFGWLGLFGIVASYFVINDSIPFPAPWAALPVMATGLVIIGGSGGRQRFLWPLTNRVSVFIGNISYSLYLWHFPIMVFAAIVIGTNPWLYFPLTVALIVVFSIGSYYLIEEPVMRSPWLEPARRSARHQNWVSWRQRFGARLKFGWLGALAVASAAIVVMGLVTTEHTVRPSASFAVPTTEALEPLADGASVDRQVKTAAVLEQASIEEALQAKSFPELMPPVSDLGLSAWSDTMRATACLNVDASNLDACAYGPTDTGKDVVLFGDSFAMAWLPTVRAGFETDGWRVHQLTRGECPSIAVEVVHQDSSAYPECAPWREWALETIDLINPELTILASAYTTADRMASNPSPRELRVELRVGTASVVDRVVASSGRTIVLGSPPIGSSLRDCAVPGATPSACIAKIAFPWTAFEESQRAAVGEGPAEYLSTKSWFCGSEDRCPAFAADTPIRTDGTHLTIEFASLLGPVLREAVGVMASSEAVPAAAAEPRASGGAG
ncbi:acyltransferase family protein [Herbiconiux sp. VKM Ac-2851]|uniref:acyltransferase family protein n=1 Tax=Herbiconiux sp. VKM Ac-2851 TaxID=2739025 RepID=UPI0021129986|nr:acyltransferase family protein [Herbiconiux sp. VKM Ac-2851]